METDNDITEISPQNGQKLESVETKIRDTFVQHFVFNTTTVPLTFVGYELIIADSMLLTPSAI